MEEIMKAKLLNPIQSEMMDVIESCSFLIAQNGNNESLKPFVEWYKELVIMYGLTIATGNNTYIKTSLRAFNDYVRKQIVVKTELEKIANGLQSIVSIME